MKIITLGNGFISQHLPYPRNFSNLTKGGTGNCVAYAEKIKKPIYRIDPRLPTKEVK